MTVNHTHNIGPVNVSSVLNIQTKNLNLCWSCQEKPPEWEVIIYCDLSHLKSKIEKYKYCTECKKAIAEVLNNNNHDRYSIKRLIIIAKEKVTFS